MKVLMTADTVGGVWTYAVELIRSLSTIQSPIFGGFEFVLATMGRLPDAEQHSEIAALPNVKLVTSQFKLEWQDDPWRDVELAGDWLLELEEEEGPHIVHLNGYALAARYFRAPKLVVGHSCVMSWWRSVKGEDAPPEWNEYRARVSRGLAAADLVVAPSAWMLGALHDHYRFDCPTKLIYNGRSDTGTHGSAPVILAKRAGALMPAPPPRNSVFAASRLWDEAKNLRTVVEAAPQIEWPVRIAGDGGSDAAGVEHLGRLDAAAMRQAYAAAGIYLFPALYEPFGLSVLEAAQAGCALVLGDIPSLREIWRDAAIFVPPRDAGAIARAVNELIRNADYREELAWRARTRSAGFTRERMASAYADAYERLLQPDPASAGVHDEAGQEVRA